MDFESSSQARFWMLNELTLSECRAKAAVVQPSTKKRARSFACGYRDRINENMGCSLEAKSRRMMPLDQETLVHFHAHQIQRLIGPNAIFPELQRSSSVLSTAIMLFRRFYLSNSIVDFHPRAMAAASALLAVKVDCEPFLEIDVLSHATSVISIKARSARVCRDELKWVSVQEIEHAEMDLMKGLEYRLRCHHPYGAIKRLSEEMAEILRDTRPQETERYGYRSSWSNSSELYKEELLETLCDRAIAVAQSALVYSDVSFLYAPGKIAFAAVAIALEDFDHYSQLGPRMTEYLRMRFPHKKTTELSDFGSEVSRIIGAISSAPGIDIKHFSIRPNSRHSMAMQMHAMELRRVFSLVARLRECIKRDEAKQKRHFAPCTVEPSPKRRRLSFCVPSGNEGKFYADPIEPARVTPVQTPAYSEERMLYYSTFV
ncbi:unnamed protein product [Cylindrotheca closterium]|uniref:Cyclin-like domain-containing protein n=1 Tax=Cylindrotheca closterium TaxID=2856 RepID=A0AAD2FQC8_9STRA|nr:unnamed protein product [Cylindrotheca closterium]